MRIFGRIFKKFKNIRMFKEFLLKKTDNKDCKVIMNEKYWKQHQ